MSCLRRCAAPCSRCMPRQGPSTAVNKRRRGTLGPSGAVRSRYLLRQQMISEGAAEDGAVVAVVLAAARGWGGNAACADTAHGECVGGSDPCEGELSRGGLANLHETRICKSEVAREPADPLPGIGRGRRRSRMRWRWGCRTARPLPRHGRAAHEGGGERERGEHPGAARRGDAASCTAAAQQPLALAAASR